MDVGDRARAERYLGQLGYYRLSGYWYPARQTSVGADAAGDPIAVVSDQFRPGTTFQRAVDLYVDGFLAGKTPTSSQQEVLNMVIDHLTERGAKEPKLLYESPFTGHRPARDCRIVPPT